MDAERTRVLPRSPPLYHYTGEAALRGILEHQKLWCVIHNQQSDDTEVSNPLKLPASDLGGGDACQSASQVRTSRH